MVREGLEQSRSFEGFQTLRVSHLLPSLVWFRRPSGKSEVSGSSLTFDHEPKSVRLRTSQKSRHSKFSSGVKSLSGPTNEGPKSAVRGFVP